MINSKLPRNVGTGTGTPLFETGYLGTSEVLYIYWFSALLRMLQPQLSVDERMEGAGVSDMSYGN